MTEEEQVNLLAKYLKSLILSTNIDRQDLKKSMLALGNYAQKNLGISTWWIRLEAIML